MVFESNNCLKLDYSGCLPLFFRHTFTWILEQPSIIAFLYFHSSLSISPYSLPFYYQFFLVANSRINSTESIVSLRSILVVNHIKGLAKIWPLCRMWAKSHTHVNEVLKTIMPFVTPRKSRLVAWESLILKNFLLLIKIKS